MADDHDHPDPAEALMREVGAQLRQVRLERGEELDQVAEHLRIKSTYLFGIEQGDLSRMPGRTYALGFLRSYADYLGFDGDDLIVQIKSTVANLTDKTRLRIRTPLPESRLPKTPILVLSLAAITAIYAGWSYVSRSGRLAVETVAEVPGNLRSMALDALGDEGSRSARRAPPVDGAAPPPAATPPAGSAAPASPSGARPAAPDEPAAAVALRAPPAVAAPAASAPTAALTEPPATSAPAAALSEAPGATAASPSPRPLASDPAGLPPLQPEAGAGQPLVTARPAAPSGAPTATAARAPAPLEDLARRAEPPGIAPDGAAGRAAVGGPLPAEEVLAALAPGAGGPAATGQIHEPDNIDARVVLRAVDSTWIQVSSLGGDYLRSRTLARGDVFLVPNRGDLELWTGNAGGIEVIVDGALLAPLGDDGAVVREVPLDPPSLRARFGP